MNAITAISIIAEVPNGRWYILDNKIDQIKGIILFKLNIKVFEDDFFLSFEWSM